MATEMYPVASFIASGEMERLKRAVMPEMRRIAMLEETFGRASRLFDTAERASRLLGTERFARGVASSLLDPARYMPKAWPTATVDITLASEATKRAFATGAAMESLGGASTVARDLARASDMFGQFAKLGGLDSLRLFRDYASTTATATTVAEAFVDEDVLPDIEPEAREQHNLATRLERLTPEQRRVAREHVEKAIVALMTFAGIATEQKAVALAGPCIALASALFGLWVLLALRKGED